MLLKIKHLYEKRKAEDSYGWTFRNLSPPISSWSTFDFRPSTFDLSKYPPAARIGLRRSSILPIMDMAGRENANANKD
jgi:hypothetical protein